MAKKRNLDEIHPLGLASAINPDLAAAVAQAAKQPKPEIKTARSKQRRVTDELVARFNRQLNGEEIPKGWFTIPAAATVAGIVANPIAAAIGTAAASGASQIVDEGSRELTGRNWTENISRGLDINPTVASYTNPGILAGGLPFTKGAKMIGNTIRGLHDAYRYGNASLQPNTLGKNVISALRKLTGKEGSRRVSALASNASTQSTLASPITRQLGLNRRLALPYLQESLPDEYYQYYLAAQDDYWNASSRRGVPYLTAADISSGDRSIYNAIGADPADINLVRFEENLANDELENAINDYIDEGDDFSSLHDRLRQLEEDARLDEDIRRDVAEQAHEFVDNPALDATPSPIEPFDWSDYERVIGLQDYIDTPNNSVPLDRFTESLLDDQQRLNEEVFGVPTNIYIQNVRYPASSVRSLADTPPIVELSHIEPQSTPVGTTSEAPLDYLDFSKLTRNQKEDKLRSIIKKDIDEILLSEEDETFLNYLRDNEIYLFNNYSSILNNVNDYKAFVKHYKKYDDLIKQGKTDEIPSSSDISPQIIRTSNRYLANYRDNDVHGRINSEGRVDIDDANFFNPAGSPNNLLNAVWKDLNRGDIISIADRGSLSRDSYPLYVMNLARILLNKNSKGFTLTRTEPLALNSLAQSHYKGVILPTTFDPNYNKTSKTRIIKALNALGENYAKKYGVENPFKNVENDIRFVSSGGYVPGFIIEKLKFGGVINRRTLAAGGSIHINPANRGKFNATKARTGKTTEELTHSKNPLTRKRAIFAQNAAKWHH